MNRGEVRVGMTVYSRDDGRQGTVLLRKRQAVGDLHKFTVAWSDGTTSDVTSAHLARRPVSLKRKAKRRRR